MGGASSFIAMLSIAAFLFSAWLATKISKAAGVSSIVLEITTGVILGPGVLGIVTESYAVCQHKRHIDCSVPPNLMDLAIKGESLGEDLDEVAAGTLCDRHNYEPWKSEHGDGHGAHGDAHGDAHSADTHEAAHGTDAHATADGHDEHATVDEHAAGHDAHGAATDGHGAAGVDGHAAGADDHASAVETHGEVTHSSADDGHHRRLSGGGGMIYRSYEECLVRVCENEISHHCQLTPDFFTLIGHTGVAMMIFESGMHFDFEKARIVGPKACLVAVLGTILPLITGSILTVIYGKPFMPDGVSVGTALAPTSVGIALRLLGEAKVLQEDFGQAIITAAFVDDILSLVLFNVLFSLRGEFHFVPVVVYPIVGIIFMAVAMAAAVKFWPKFINETIMPKIPERPDAKVSPKDEVLFLLMMVVLVVYATATYFLGTHLWGCFIAGMSFACIDKHHWPHHVWVKQTKRATSWMIRIFFAATVAFSIPVSQLLSISAFLKGSVMGIGPCILTKVLCAPFMGPAKFVIGWAMVGRAEFAYLIAQMAAAANMVDSETFSVVIWALLYATVFAPFIFRKVLDRYVQTYCKDVLERIESGEQVEDDGLAEVVRESEAAH